MSTGLLARTRNDRIVDAASGSVGMDRLSPGSMGLHVAEAATPGEYSTRGASSPPGGEQAVPEGSVPPEGLEDLGGSLERGDALLADGRRGLGPVGLGVGSP